MDFAQQDAVFAEAVQRLPRFLEFDGQVAGVVVYTEVEVEAVIGRPVVA